MTAKSKMMHSAEHSAEKVVLPSEHHKGRKAVAAGVVGHILEWYDFAVYGYVALYIAANFFPSTNETTSLLASFATFGVGFVARPLGGLIFGRLGDRKGRKAVLLATLLLMAAATFLIGLLPSYSTIGIWAPVLLVAARLAQGFSAGGETTAAAAFIVEWAPHNRRGLYGSFQQVGSAAGLLLGTLTVAVITTFLSQEAMSVWGWRIPFLIGAILAPVGFMIRRSVEETPAFDRVANAPSGAARLEAAPVNLTGLVVKAFLFTLFWSVGFYFFLSYMPTFAQRELKLDGSSVFWINTFASAVYLMAIPAFGAASDFLGRKPVLLTSCVGFAVLLIPVFSMLTSGASTQMFTVAMLMSALLLAMYTGPAAATLSEIFPTRYRSSGMAIGYSLSTVVFGGFTPFIATWLISAFGTPLAPIYYVVACAAAGAIFIATLRETAKEQLQ
jgi:MHS family proline/betaine transporter-like MFS transporter